MQEDSSDIMLSHHNSPGDLLSIWRSCAPFEICIAPSYDRRVRPRHVFTGLPNLLLSVKIDLASLSVSLYLPSTTPPTRLRRYKRIEGTNFTVSL